MTYSSNLWVKTELSTGAEIVGTSQATAAGFFVMPMRFIYPASQKSTIAINAPKPDVRLEIYNNISELSTGSDEPSPKSGRRITDNSLNINIKFQLYNQQK